MSKAIKLTAFRLMLPMDGTHRELVERARAAGLPFEFADADWAVQLAHKSSHDYADLAYTIDQPDAGNLERVAVRLGACARLAQAGDGLVPDKAPDGHATDREKLKRMRDVFRVASDAIEALLEATRP